MEYDKDEIVKQFNKMVKTYGIKLLSGTNFFNETIIIIDLERSGTTYNEIVDFCGIKIKSGEFISYLHLEFNPIHGIEKSLIGRYLREEGYYKGKSYIKDHKNEIIDFLKNSMLFFWDKNNDVSSLKSEFLNEFKETFFKKTKIIDVCELKKILMVYQIILD